LSVRSLKPQFQVGGQSEIMSWQTFSEMKVVVETRWGEVYGMVLHGMGWGSTGPERAGLDGTVRGGRDERGVNQSGLSARYTALFKKTRDLPSRLG
jgi:hypothetical protein